MAAQKSSQAWPADKVERRSIASLIPYARNSRTHSAEQVDQIASAIKEWGWTTPVLIDPDGGIIAGHGRVMAAKKLGIEEIPVMVAEGWSEAQKRAYVIADNKLAENAGWDTALLKVEFDELRGLDFDLGLTGFSLAEIGGIDLMAGGDGDPAENDANEPGEAEESSSNSASGSATGSLADRFMVVPFSVLNAREGWWQNRKRQWLAIGIQSEMGRGENLLRFSDTINEPNPEKRAKARHAPNATPAGGGGAFKAMNEKMAKNRAKLQGTDAVDVKAIKTIGTTSWMNEKGLSGGCSDGDPAVSSGTSIFDPVLCEVSYRWFSPASGTILDPFAGGSVRGIVASKLSRQYVGCELREEQVLANRAQADKICSDPQPVWCIGDSRHITRHAKGIEADFVFSCPPYADLEVYSDNPQDISTLSYPDFREAYSEIIKAVCSMLKPDRFAAFVIGEVRGKRGGYYGFVPDTIRAFEDAGLTYYNEIILVTAAGSLPIRAGKQFSSTRKVGKTHQNILVFCKGDPKKATEACGTVEISDDMFAGLDPEVATDQTNDPSATQYGEVL